MDELKEAESSKSSGVFLKMAVPLAETWQVVC